MHRVSLACLAALAALLLSSRAEAYPWMIRHHYTACNACHFDPSGSGALTPYGRAVADTALRMGGDSQGGSGDLPQSAAFLFGVVPTPEWLELGGDVRVMNMASNSQGSQLTSRLIWMQLDGEATVNLSHFVASGSLGYAPEGALGAALTRGTDSNLVSRQHWLGYRGGDSLNVFLRAGRMNLPFGIRTIEHTLWARKLTQTNINDQQQYGVSAYLGGSIVRAELMAIAGNFQLRPDDYRERGYSGYLELAPVDALALGVSSLITHRDLDPVTLKETWRQVHGVFGRWVTPYEPLVFLSEWDYSFKSSKDEFHEKGLVSYLQADWEPVQGMHFLATGELNRIGRKDRHYSWGGWLSYAWFMAPHFDLRLDGITQSLAAGDERTQVYTVLLQGHMFL